MPLRCCFLAVSALICSGADKGLTDFMADKADAVVEGEVQSGQQSGRSAIFVLVVSRCLKGDVARKGKSSGARKKKQVFWYLTAASYSNSVYVLSLSSRRVPHRS